MLGILGKKLSVLEDVKAVLISDITTLFTSHEKQSLEDLLREVDGIKTLFTKINPLIIITAPYYDYN